MSPNVLLVSSLAQQVETGNVTRYVGLLFVLTRARW